MKKTRSQSGQALVEAVLLMAVTVSIGIMVVRFLEDKVPSLVTGPWALLSGMVECGNWSGCGPGLHPNTLERVISYKPDE
ncbi:MAG: hypothetical protein ACAH59_12800 [Pseudobdellovibrionaceae bacterium]